MNITIYGIPNCDTVKKARAWLNDNALPHRFHDFKKDGVPAARLGDWIAQLGWEALVNRRGTTWRKLDLSAQQAVSDGPTSAALMQREPSVIKRPVVDWGTSLTVGFDPEEWRRKLDAAS